MTERDKKAILSQGFALCHAKVDGVSIVTNGHVILPMEPWFENKEGDIVNPESVERKWRSIPERLGKSKAVRVKTHSKFNETYVAILSNDTTLDTAYLYLFEGCEVFSASRTEIVIFVRDQSIVGALMPLRHIPACSMTGCEAPTLDAVFAGMEDGDERRIRSIEQDISSKHGEIADLEYEIKDLNREIDEIRKRKKERNGNLEQVG